MPFEYGGQTWPDLAHVIRKKQVRLLHPTPDIIDGYKCRYPNALVGTPDLEFRTSPVHGLTREPDGFLTKDAEGVHTGQIQLHLVPGQDAAGEMRCQAFKMEPRLLTIGEYQAWKVTHPDEEPVRLYSDWSNARPLGDVLPDPVPEPTFGVSLLLGVLALAIIFKVFRRNAKVFSRKAVT